MSKLIEQRLEYACADTASLALIPPTYPPVLDQYQIGNVASVAESYGFMPVSSTGASVPLPYTPAGATVLMVCDPTNTTLCGVSAGGNIWAGGPAQIVTIPGVYTTGTLTISAYTTAMVASTTAFNATLVWYL